MYSTKYPTIRANASPNETWVFPTDINDLPVMNPYTRPIKLSASITNVKIAKILKYKQYDFGRGP
jgi:hypothetical protein